jgi:chromosome partitioning protein
MEGTTVSHNEGAATGGRRPTVLVIGNEKGGTGKSTTAVHLAVALLHQGRRVATLDLDPRQRTLTRYLENRERHTVETGRRLALPHHTVTDPLEGADAAATVVARARIAKALTAAQGYDWLIVDTPGNASALARAAHEVADVLVTPLNDSAIDLDVLARINWESRVVEAPSVYCRFVWECRQHRASDGGALDWIVVRSRVGHTLSHNRRDVAALMEVLAANIGFRLGGGIGERVVFRELFARGLTLLDDPATSSSHRAARDELEALVHAIDAPVAAAA